MRQWRLSVVIFTCSWMNLGYWLWYSWDRNCAILCKNVDDNSYNIRLSDQFPSLVVIIDENTWKRSRDNNRFYYCWQTFTQLLMLLKQVSSLALGNNKFHRETKRYSLFVFFPSQHLWHFPKKSCWPQWCTSHHHHRHY